MSETSIEQQVRLRADEAAKQPSKAQRKFEGETSLEQQARINGKDVE